MVTKPSWSHEESSGAAFEVIDGHRKDLSRGRLGGINLRMPGASHDPEVAPRNVVGEVALGRERALAPSILRDAHARAGVYESLRLLHSRIIASIPEEGHAVIAVCSALDGEGKTTVAIALAELLADEFNRQTLLVDANLNQPQIHTLLDTHESPGLKDCLSSGGLIMTAIEWTGRLWVLPAGTDPSIMADGPESPREIFKTLRSLFPLTIVDLPAVYTRHSSPILPHWADAAVWVVRADSTPAGSVTQSMDLVGRDKVIGVVLNGQKSRVPSWLERLL